jgi:hypothetical protein
MIKQTIQNLVIKQTENLKQRNSRQAFKYSDLLKHGEDHELPLVTQHAVAHCLQQDHQASG